jgi:hypothetical protein
MRMRSRSHADAELRGCRCGRGAYAYGVNDDLFVRIGSASDHAIVVRPTRRERPESTEYWDGNWVIADVEVAAGAFRGRYGTSLRAEELHAFRDGMRALGSKLDGLAAFKTIEEQLRIQIVGDGRGHFHAACHAIDAPGDGSRLTFDVDFDQTELVPIVRALDRICDAFPIVGAR